MAGRESTGSVSDHLMNANRSGNPGMVPVSREVTPTESDASGSVETMTPQETSERTRVLKIGIFNSDADIPIANKLVDKLESLDCEVERYDFFSAGVAKMEVLNEFISSHDVVVWIASATALKDDAMMKNVMYITHHASVVLKLSHFIHFQPMEYLNQVLPPTLAAYTPLKEDQFFDQRLDSTLKRFRKKKLESAKKRNMLQHGTSSTNAVANEHSQFNSVPPISDVNAGSLEQPNPLRVAGQHSAPVLCAKPDSSDCTPESVQTIENQEAAAPLHVTHTSDGGNVINNYFISGSNVQVMCS